jgi:hypothetical protein
MLKTTHGSINDFLRINLLLHVCVKDFPFLRPCDPFCVAALGAIIGAAIGIINQQISQRQQDLSSHEAAYEDMCGSSNVKCF